MHDETLHSVIQWPHGYESVRGCVCAWIVECVGWYVGALVHGCVCMFSHNAWPCERASESEQQFLKTVSKTGAKNLINTLLTVATRFREVLLVVVKPCDSCWTGWATTAPTPPSRFCLRNRNHQHFIEHYQQQKFSQSISSHDDLTVWKVNPLKQQFSGTLSMGACRQLSLRFLWSEDLEIL